MPRPKIYKITISDEQLTKFKSALHSGSPLMVALSYAQIPPAKYFYYVELANISAYFREMEIVKEEEQLTQSGVELSQVRSNAESLSTESTLHQLRVPTAQSILRYKNNKGFKDFCDSVYDLLTECDMLRAEITLFHLGQIRKASENRRINAVASQWFLERTMPDYFGRSDKTKIEGSFNSTSTIIGRDDTNSLPPIKVEFVDPNTKESKDRVREMESKVLDQLNGKQA